MYDIKKILKEVSFFLYHTLSFTNHFLQDLKKLSLKFLLLNCKNKIYLLIFGLEYKSLIFRILSQITLKSKDIFVSGIRRKT